ncbi:SGNH/GDSL hydrolase family protein [Tautonia plasticadhaerens]|uniref:GDSL-like Lipase/Acylhydrolase n=1 Tax=Tautonia plasticadhaerens TaxID=2527974 RepID=A0A518GUY3_9BACT|nr:SGNH/GDSL hydrolase family protein [Tautonia plasticadhaerens]QDV32395.1 GDSL-like Lipase/Acylhydrolase [Tautonia plasticadhaerens]
MTHPAIALGLLAGALAAPPPQADEPDDRPPLELRDGDRVVLVGDALIERMQQYGYLEALLTAAHPERSITFRNLGWSGDTVFGEARAGFGTPEDGFKTLIEQVKAAEPTVLIVGYGANESWAGEAGLPRFREGYDRLLDALEATGAREIVLLSPIAQQGPGPVTRPGGVANMAELVRYTGEVERIAAERGHRFVNLHVLTFGFGSGLGHDAPPYYSSDGVHLSERGYEELARRLSWRGSGVFEPDGEITRASITAGDDLVIEATKCSIEDAVPTLDGLRFGFARSSIPDTRSSGPDLLTWGAIRVEGLPDGRYRVQCEGRPLPEGHANVNGQMGAFVMYDPGIDRPSPAGTLVVPGAFIPDEAPDLEQFESLRQAIIAKNRLYFHRYRPQNSTYLFGFRKHEQGNNAAEVEEFERLVAEAEAEIARLKVPQSHIYELERIDEEDADR